MSTLSGRYAARPKSWVIVAVVCGSLGLLAVAASIVVAGYTPTITIRVLNDTSERVTLAGCASDPATIAGGMTVRIDPNKDDPGAACVVYRGETRAVLGCLLIPTTQYHDGALVEVSSLVRNYDQACGD